MLKLNVYFGLVKLIRKAWITNRDDIEGNNVNSNGYYLIK